MSTNDGFEPVQHRMIITVCTMGATLMQSLDQTIANVALPYMQGSMSASSDEITWVLTSYITAAAIMTAPVGWFASRFGRKRFFIACLVGFTITSMMCGAAQSLPQIVLFRILQGMFGAALVPLSQATMMDIYPPEKRGAAMAIWGVGVMIGPILGPTLGGYLTELYSWRYVFYINLPFGILASIGLLIFMPRVRGQSAMRFDWIGFFVLSMGIGGLQLMLDRGEDQDWFTSSEIIIECVLGGLGVYLFMVHLLTAQRPFIRPGIFRDRNFSAGLAMMFAMGTILVSSSALMAPWLQNLGNYPVATAGLTMAPRGIGTMAAMMFAGRYSNRIDPRLLMGLGLVMLCWSYVGDDRLDARRDRARGGTGDRRARRGPGAGVHPAAGAGLRHAADRAAHRRRIAVQPAPQHRRGDRGVGHLRRAGAQRAGAACRDWCVCQPVQSRAAARRGAADVGCDARAWGGGVGSVGQSAGADHCVYG